MKIKTAEYVTSFGMLFMFAYVLLLSSFGASSADVPAEVNNDVDLLKSRTEISENDVTYRSVISSLLEWKSRRRRRRQLNVRRKRSSEVKVCYPEIGCFYETGYIDMLPNSPEEINTRFLFYNSKKCRGDTPLLDVSAQNMSTVWKWTEKAFNISASMKVIIHGFGSSCTNIWVYEMRSALMSAEDCNVICVDWEAGATIPNYVRAAANTRIVGKQVAMLISGLQKHVNLLPTNIHMIGFSLGAHVAGFAGTEIKNLSRITGLDPAGPLFESQDRRARLDSTDAKFVDVIHSNGENLILGGLGAWQPMGHVDFYPNGGRMQKGCTNLFVGAVSDMIWAANEVYGRSLCNHRRAYKFFTDSISLKCQFPAVPCESYDHFLEGKCFPCKDIDKCGNMGYYANKYNGTGKLYLLTRDEEPFCAHQYMIKVESVTRYINSEKIVTYGKIQIMLIGDLELNETFTVTQKKDDKIISGEVLSKIIVPHPAMQNFFHIQIIYTAYNGWLSTGLKQWSINKVSLTDSYNQKLSVCRNDLVLESGEPYTLPLYPGDCMIHETNVNKTATDFVEDDDGKNPQNMSRAEENYTVVPNDTSFYELTDSSTDSWTPLYYTKADFGTELKSNNPLYKCEDCTESSEINSLSIVDDTAKICALLQNSSNYGDAGSSTSLYYNCIMSNRNGKKIKMNNGVYGNGDNSSGEYAPDYLRLTTSKSNPGRSTTVHNARSNGRSHNSKSINIHDPKNESASEYLNPPLEKATESWKYWRSSSPSAEERNRSDDVRSLSNNRTDNHFVVHFLPERLMSFLHKAEQYVKLALVPFMPDLKQTSENNTTQFFGEGGRSITSSVFNTSKNRSNVFRNGLEEENFKIRRSNNNVAFMPYSDKQLTKRNNPDSRYIPLHLAYNENTNQTDGQYSTKK